MKFHWIALAAILLSDTANGDSSITTESLVTKAGYPFEEHECKTSDGYLLTIHRIPYSGRVNTSSTPKPVAFLMHGIFAASTDWVVLGPDKSLGYMLSDAGYDVWMGNARGNRYSRKHVTRSPLSKSFWNFGLNEIGVIDLPAMIDCIRSQTNVEQVQYFSHSQGCTVYLIFSSLNSEAKSRIKSAHLLAPAAYLDHIRSPILNLLIPFIGNPQPLVEVLGSFELFPNTKLQELLADLLCSDSSLVQFACPWPIFLLTGPDQDNMNTTMLPKFLSTIPAGSSINQAFHFAQISESGNFRQFDYGSARNVATYGRTEPPDYPLGNIDVPTFLYYGANDYIVSVKDVSKLISQLSNNTLRGSYRVPHQKWNHLDFIWGTYAKELVYDVIIKNVASIK